MGIYDTDFHPLNWSARRNQISIQEAASQPIVIGSDVWLGVNTTVLKGVVIGDRACVRANSLVNKAIPADQLWAGVPARCIRSLLTQQ